MPGEEVTLHGFLPERIHACREQDLLAMRWRELRRQGRAETATGIAIDLILYSGGHWWGQGEGGAVLLRYCGACGKQLDAH